MEGHELLLPMGDAYQDYLKDESRVEGRAAEIAFPKTAEELKALFALLRARGSAATLQGGRTGIAGAAVPADGGTVVSLSRMQAITGLETDGAGGFAVTLQPGVQLEELNRALERRHFDTGGWSAESLAALEALKKAPAQFFPPDPTETTATFGGMFSTNAQGLCAFRYGPFADYVEHISLLLPDGWEWEISRGRYVFDAKGVDLPGGGRLDLDAGYIPVCRTLAPQEGMDLVDLLAGSEGMLGAVTSLTVRLLPAPAHHWAVMFFFPALEGALEFSKRLAGGGEEYRAEIEAVEFFDRGSLNLVTALKEQVSKLKAIPEIEARHAAAVYVQLAAGLEEEAEDTLYALLETFCACGGNEDDTWAAVGEGEMEKFRQFRHAVPEAVNVRVDNLRHRCPTVRKTASDFFIPPRRLDEAMAMYREGLEKCGIPGVIFGHVGLGRLHVNFFPETRGESERAWQIIDGWAGETIALGGRILDESGVGKLKRSLLLRHIPQAQLAAARAVKGYFDPEGMLNPGNML